MQLGSETSVDEVVTRFPRTARAFVRRRMHCVGCPLARFETLADVCGVYAQPLDSLLAEVRALVDDEGARQDPGDDCSRRVRGSGSR